MGAQSITFSEILAYCELYEIRGLDRLILSRTIVDMDSAWLVWANKKAK